MILVHVPDGWPQYLSGKLSAAEVTLGDWYGISEANFREFGDVVLPIFENEVVHAWDITDRHFTSDGKTVFDATPSVKWAHLIGTPNPGKPWGIRGMARPIQYIDTRIVAATVPVEDNHGIRRASIDGYTLTIDDAKGAILSIPAGSRVTILTTAA